MNDNLDTEQAHQAEADAAFLAEERGEDAEAAATYRRWIEAQSRP